jgi:hypothetical protein
MIQLGHQVKGDRLARESFKKGANEGAKRDRDGSIQVAADLSHKTGFRIDPQGKPNSAAALPPRMAATSSSVNFMP